MPTVSTTTPSIKSRLRLSIAARTLKAFCQQAQYTHAASAAPPGYIQLYAVTTCAQCGIELMAANSVKAVATLHDATAAGLTVDGYPQPPEEGVYSEALDQVTCTSCYVD